MSFNEMLNFHALNLLIIYDCYNRSVKSVDIACVFLILTFYIGVLFFTHKEIFVYHFDQTLIKKYFLSQDIPHEVPGKRLFLSDENIYISSGYLYAKGADPSGYNFDHPPLLKYLFGYAIVLFANPYIIQIFLGAIFIFLVYYSGLKIYKSTSVSILACLLLIIDPLFIDSTSHAMLDLGEVVFLFLYVMLALFYKRNYFLLGITLGLFAGAKSLTTPVFFILLLSFYQWYKKEFDLKIFIKQIVVAGITFTFLYIQSFIQRDGLFNIFFFALKTVKYRINHNVTSFPGASLLLFITSYFQTWWGEREFLSVKTWTFFWPIGLGLCLFQVKKYIKRKLIDAKFLFVVVPLLYFLYLGIQAPFPRYFLIILPFLYLTFANTAYVYLMKNKIKTK